MSFALDAPETISETVTQYKITAFSVDLRRKEIVVAYEKLNADGALILEGVIELPDPDFTASIVDASAIAGTDVYAPLRHALYNKIVEKTGAAGTVS